MCVCANVTVKLMSDTLSHQFSKRTAWYHQIEQCS